MNQYGRLALHHCRQNRLDLLASLEHPDRYFSQVGEEIQEQVTQIRDQILGSMRPGEDLETYRRRGYQAQATAVELVLADHHLFRSQDDPDEDDPAMARYLAELEGINREFRDPEP